LTTSKIEIEYLAELIKDFPTNTTVDPDKALDIINDRFRALESADFIESVCKASERIVNEQLLRFFINLVKLIHRYLYGDILSNAGRYRKNSDPDYGKVSFGGNKPHALKQKYTGAPPKYIRKNLKIAFSWLNRNPVDPVDNALRFYQHFVQIHPFYDANGRIARLIITVYLRSFKFHLLWSELNKSQYKFLHKLNQCHDCFGQEVFEKYFRLFSDFCRKFIIPIQE